MMRFFLSYRFWLPFLVILGLEFAFELRLYEPLVKRDSHSGTSIKVRAAMKEFGYNNIDYVTLGDSRADLALNHRTIYEAALHSGQRHISMAMPGSHFTTFKTASRFFRSDLPNLKGVVFVISTGTLTRLFNGYYELGIIQPFRQPGDWDQVLQTINFRFGNAESYGAVSSLFQYQEDIKDLVTHPADRIGAVFKKRKHWKDVLAHDKWSDLDMCSVDLGSPGSCSDSVDRLIREGGQLPTEKAEQLQRIKTICATYGTKMNLPVEGEIARVRESWTQLIRSLRFKKRPIVVLLPDSGFIEKHHFPTGTREWALSILKPMTERGEITLIDYSNSLNVGDTECRYFFDPLHLNSPGMESLTSELLPILAEYYR